VFYFFTIYDLCNCRKQNQGDSKPNDTFCDARFFNWILHFQMIRFVQPTAKNLKVLIPMVVQILDEAGINRAEWSVEKSLVYLQGIPNWENLVACLICNQSAIFGALKM
jgi:hypothetical protein